ncbi:GNAT family N-acetyltransferase [Ideonella sp.]|uniref:GNAT family N-acetyltransferase n=1 Tax=Ideonella sp. TaxID=1929293 RepID=UPI0035B3DA66
MASATLLRPMGESAFADFRERSVESFARENITAGRWPAHEAPERSRLAYERLLPQGLRTPGHHLFTVHEAHTGQAVGAVWLALSEHPTGRAGYVYDLVIDAAFRRQGHGRGALAALEAIARSWGVTELGLHVFMHNRAAQGLYRALGFEPTGLQLQKRLA